MEGSIMVGAIVGTAIVHNAKRDVLPLSALLQLAPIYYNLLTID